MDIEFNNNRSEDLARCAREFCYLIDDLQQAGSEWLERLAGLLVQIHAAVIRLDEYADGAIPKSPGPDYDRRFELYSRLRRLLGERDHYWTAFDSNGIASEISGSLADDITDIYFELKQGLEMVEQDPQRAACQWRISYQQHWGQHLVDAERHLYELKVSQQPRLY